MILAITMAVVIVLIILIGKVIDKAEAKSEENLEWAVDDYKSIE